MGSRRKAREYALMVLYEVDLSQVPAEAACRRFYEAFATGDSLDPAPPFLQPREDRLDPPDEEMQAYVQKLVFGVTGNLEAIDAKIQEVSSHWRIDRMSCVDRNLLRIGTFELVFLSEEVPRKVVINEAVEIAKRYGTKESSAFVNGVLDRIRK